MTLEMPITDVLTLRLTKKDLESLQTIRKLRNIKTRTETIRYCIHETLLMIMAKHYNLKEAIELKEKEDKKAKEKIKEKEKKEEINNKTIEEITKPRRGRRQIRQNDL